MIFALCLVTMWCEEYLVEMVLCDWEAGSDKRFGDGGGKALGSDGRSTVRCTVGKDDGEIGGVKGCS